jgi:hypothetical protein
LVIGLPLGTIACSCHPAPTDALAIAPFVGSVTIKLSGFLTENPGTVGTGPNGGSGGKETTWGGGYVITIFETGNPMNVLWQSGKNSQTLSSSSTVPHTHASRVARSVVAGSLPYKKNTFTQ